MEIRLFDDRGNFTPLDEAALAGLSAPRRALYDAVADAADAMVRADSELKTASDHVRECMAAVSEAEKATQANRMTAHDLWKETFGRPRAKPAG